MKTFQIILLFIMALAWHFFALEANEEFETVFAFIAVLCYIGTALGTAYNILKWIATRK